MTNFDDWQVHQNILWFTIISCIISELDREYNLGDVDMLTKKVFSTDWLWKHSPCNDAISSKLIFPHFIRLASPALLVTAGLMQACLLELETKVREDFTITKPAKPPVSYDCGKASQFHVYIVFCLGDRLAYSMILKSLRTFVSSSKVWSVCIHLGCCLIISLLRGRVEEEQSRRDHSNFLQWLF